MLGLSDPLCRPSVYVCMRGEAAPMSPPLLRSFSAKCNCRLRSAAKMHGVIPKEGTEARRYVCSVALLLCGTPVRAFRSPKQCARALLRPRPGNSRRDTCSGTYAPGSARRDTGQALLCLLAAAWARGRDGGYAKQRVRRRAGAATHVPSELCTRQSRECETSQATQA